MSRAADRNNDCQPIMCNAHPKLDARLDTNGNNEMSKRMENTTCTNTMIGETCDWPCLKEYVHTMGVL